VRSYGVRVPKIGLTVPRQQSSAYREYRQRIDESGGVAIEVTPQSTPSAVIAALDGLLLPGGGDVDPARYGEAARPETDGIRPDLDALEVELVRLARERRLPVLAICRGHQLLNVAFGGSLHQHIAGDAHRAEEGEGHPSRWHTVRIAPESRLAGLLGPGELRVNSRHHQAVLPERLAPGLRAVAWSPDGLVEGMEPQDGSWLLAVQWHPERAEVIDRCRPLFDAFVDAALERRERGVPPLPVAGSA
jgi:putative glutamine amidotransferase